MRACIEWRKITSIVEEPIIRLVNGRAGIDYTLTTHYDGRTGPVLGHCTVGVLSHYEPQMTATTDPGCRPKQAPQAIYSRCVPSRPFTTPYPVTPHLDIAPYILGLDYIGRY